MKLHRTICSLFLVVAGGVAGFFLGGLRGERANILAADKTPATEYFLSTASFSEVATARDMLAALSTRFLSESRVKYVFALQSAHTDGAASEPRPAPDFRAAIQDLERGVEEFAGTDHELLVTADLLWVLKHAKHHDRWLDLYLGVLYRHPTHWLVGSMAGDAAQIARLTGRELEVTRAFQHVRDIPISFEGRWRIEAVPSPVKHTTSRATQTSGEAVSPG